jgi:L-amino acid N-acyltransferase YncA
MTTRAESASRPVYPREIQFADGPVTLRYMTANDREAALAFARALPSHDLLFLRRDITRPEIIDLWLDGIRRERIVSIFAERKGAVLGYATVDRGDLSWSPHVAELRVMVGASMRRQRLGQLLTREAFMIALNLGVEKMTAQMTTDQEGAIAVFEGMGFHTEALLRDQIKDREGRKHDLLIMANDVNAFLAQMEAYGVAEALES